MAERRRQPKKPKTGQPPSVDPMAGYRAPIMPSRTHGQESERTKRRKRGQRDRLGEFDS